jgi:hypothetical protein
MVSANAEQAVSNPMYSTRRPPHPVPMSPLQLLIQEVRDNERGLSFAKLAKRSERADGSGGLSRGRMHQLATQPVRRGLDQETREALARALRVPQSVINDAVSQSVGTFVQQGIGPDTRQLLIYVGDLPEEQRRLWFRLARAIADTLAFERDSTGTESDRLEEKPALRSGSEPLPTVTTERAQLTPEISTVLGRLGEAAESSPELREELATFSEDLFRRYDETRTGE